MDSDSEETQSPSSGQERNEWSEDEETVPLAGETQLLDFDDEETQKLGFLEYDDDHNNHVDVRTQQLFYSSDDGQGTDNTQVLSDADCNDDGVSAEKGYVVDSDVSANGDDHCLGSVERSFMSVRAASLRASGQAAARSMTPKGINGEAICFPDSTPSGKIHIGKDDRRDGLRDPVSVGIEEVKEIDLGNDLLNCDTDMIGNTDKTRLGGAKSAVRKLFDEGVSTTNHELVYDSGGHGGANKLPDSPANDHNIAGLSYVGSQEPGEYSQANALDVVDRYIAFNYVDLSQEDGYSKTLKELSPPASKAKGTQILAKSSAIRSPVRDERIFDWDGNYEDEVYTAFSDKRKTALVRSRCHGQRPLTESKKPRISKSRKSRSESNKPEDNSINLHQNIKGLNCSDTRVKLPNSRQKNKMVKTFEVGMVKNLSIDLDGKLTADHLEKPLEGRGSGMDLPDAYDIGFDTQMAAEAMEALCHAETPIQETDNLQQVLENVACDFPGVLTNSEASLKRINSRKRGSSVSGDAAMPSTRRRKTDTKVDNHNCIPSRTPLNIPQKKESRQVSFVKKKSKKVKSKTEEHSRNGISGDGKEDIGFGSSESFEHKKSGREVEKPHSKDPNRCSLSLLKDNHEVSEGRLQEDLRSFTPIACRTRSSKAVKPLTGFISHDGAVVAKDMVESRICGVKRRGRCSGRDARGAFTTQGKNDKLPSSQKAKVQKSKLIKLESPGNCLAQQEIETNEKCDLPSHSRAKRTRGSITGSLSSGNLDGPSTVTAGQDAQEQYIPRRKRSKIGARGLSRAKSSTEWGRRVVAIASSLLDNGERYGMLDVTSGDKIKLSNTPFITLVNCKSAIELPSPVCLGQKSCSNKAAPRPTMKELRRTRTMADVRVLLSNHLDDDISKQQKKISSRLGLSLVSTSSEATHFIADKFVRTRNMLEAIAFGKPVVTHLWLESCGLANSYVDEQNYILRDSEKEKVIGFSMPVSLARARACHSQLLQGKRIYITPNVKPSRELVASLATAVHGQVLKRLGTSTMKGDTVPEDFLVLSCEEDYATCVPLLLKRTAVYSSELLLNGIVTQKLEYERHRLFGNPVKRSERVKRTTAYG